MALKAGVLTPRDMDMRQFGDWCGKQETSSPGDVTAAIAAHTASVNNTTEAELVAAILAHTVSTDNTTQAELDSAISTEVTNRNTAIASEATARNTAIASAITTHEGASDPHPGYLTPAEGNAAYQPLAAVLSMLHTGTGSPETVVTATIGHVFLRSDGGAGTTFYVKESGSGNTGWVAK